MDNGLVNVLLFYVLGKKLRLDILNVKCQNNTKNILKEDYLVNTEIVINLYYMDYLLKK